MRVVLITDASTAQDRWFTTDASSDTGYLPPSLVGHPNGERPRRSHGFFSVHCVAAHVLPPRSPKRVRVRFVQALSSAFVSWRCEGAIRVRAQTWTNELRFRLHTLEQVSMRTVMDTCLR